MAFFTPCFYEGYSKACRLVISVFAFYTTKLPVDTNAKDLFASRNHS